VSRPAGGRSKGILILLGLVALVAGAVVFLVGSSEGWTWRASGFSLLFLSVVLMGSAMVGPKGGKP